jgi:hypothetical protein
MMLQDAIQTYHDLLDDELAGASQAQLDDQQRRRGLFFGSRPLCNVLRPRFMTPDQYRFLQSRVGVLLGAFAKIYRAAMADDAFRAQFWLLDWEEELLRGDPGFRAPSPTSRLDTFFLAHPPAHALSAPALSRHAQGTDGMAMPAQDRGATGGAGVGPGGETYELHLVEYNAETPAAPAYNDVLSEVFYGLPVMREFLRRYEVYPLLARHSVVHALLDAYHQWSGRREAPRIAILDWREVPTYSEFVVFAEYFESQGLACVIADPREVEYRDGRLIAGDFPITLVYKRVLISELIERGGLDHPVVRAVRDGAVCMVNPFRCKILHKKASLAVLSDERNADLFSAEERQAIDAHIPWTRRVEERHTRYHDQAVDLLPFIVAHRERFVLKANDEYGGKGIVLGWQTTSTSWEQAVRAALSEPSVVQERVPVPSEPYPSLANGQLMIADRLLDTDPFIFHGDYVGGCLTRLSTQDLLNVTAGGGTTVPTFLVEKR